MGRSASFRSSTASVRFEAAARGESFAKAADELNVTPAAVSRMVQLLEQRLDVPLFERKPNRLTLTAAGRAYQAGLTQLFDQLANLTAQVTAMAGSRVLTIGVGPTFATRWLIPRLADFQKTAPDVEVRFATGGATVPYNDEWTCGIRLGDGDWPDFAVEPLFSADLRPVCAPAMAKRLKDAGRSARRHAAACRARGRRLDALVQGGERARSAPGARVRILRPGAAGGRRRRRRRDGDQPLCRRRPEGRAAGGAVRADGVEGRALVSGHRPSRRHEAALQAFPRLDHRRRPRDRQGDVHSATR
jgi:DNA-binding transcriptional LysR family regulator